MQKLLVTLLIFGLTFNHENDNNAGDNNQDFPANMGEREQHEEDDYHLDNDNDMEFDSPLDQNTDQPEDFEVPENQ